MLARQMTVNLLCCYLRDACYHVLSNHDQPFNPLLPVYNWNLFSVSFQQRRLSAVTLLCIFDSKTTEDADMCFIKCVYVCICRCYMHYDVYWKTVLIVSPTCLAPLADTSLPGHTVSVCSAVHNTVRVLSNKLFNRRVQFRLLQGLYRSTGAVSSNKRAISRRTWPYSKEAAESHAALQQLLTES